MSRLSFILTNGGAINVLLLPEGKNYLIAPAHVNYNHVKAALLKNDTDLFLRMIDVPTAVSTHSAGAVEIRQDGNVYWNGTVLHNAISDRILNFMRQGFPFKPMMLFLDRLMKNPSKRAVDELFKFLSHQDLTITEDGCFLGYKRVNDDYKDFRTNTVDNRIGSKPFMLRNAVDDDWRNLCSSGFHVGSIDYVRNFHKGEGHVMIVKVDPADVVSVPDSEDTKLRTAAYEVVAEYDKDLGEPMPDTLHSASGQPMESPVGMGGYGYDRNDDDDDDDLDSDLDDDDVDSELEDDGPITD